MTIKQKEIWQSLAGASGFIAVVMGAIGAHAIADEHLSTLAEKASYYQLIHSALLLWLADKQGFKWPRSFVLAGIVFFCGSLYLKALTGWNAATTFAPFGGICFMAGWLSIAITRSGE